MSLSWPDQWLVGLSPGAVQLARYARGWRPRLLQARSVHCDAHGAEAWRAALDTLERELPPPQAAPRCRVVLSNHFLRYELLPWRAELRSAEERSAQARARLRAIHGEVAQHWSVGLDPAGFGAPTLACAVDRALVRELARLLAARKASIRPYAGAVFDRWRRELQAAAFRLVILEPGRLWLGRAERGSWTSVAARRLGADPVAETVAVLEREGAASGGVPPQTYGVVSGFAAARIGALRKTGMHVLACGPESPLVLQ